MVNVFGDQGRPEAAGFEWAGGIENPYFMPLLVGENGEVECTGNVILCEFRR